MQQWCIFVVVFDMFSNVLDGREERPNEYDAARRLAYRSRVALLRNSYISERLMTEPSYNAELYDLCCSYEAHFKDRYATLKRTLREEEFLRNSESIRGLRRHAAIIFHQPGLTRGGIILAVLSSIVVLGSATALLIESLPSFNPVIHGSTTSAPLLALEIFVTLYLTLETAVGLVVHPNRSHYARSAFFWIDVIGILPLYVTLGLGPIAPSVTEFADPFRMFRLFRLVKYFVDVAYVSVLIRTLQRTLSVLLGPLFVVVSFCFVLASAMYYSQRGTFSSDSGFQISNCVCEESPPAINTSFSCPAITSSMSDGIPINIWWGLETITTVGFGDIVPNCPQGKVIATLGMIFLPILVAMPIALLGQKFLNETDHTASAAVAERSAVTQNALKESQQVVQLALVDRLHEMPVETLARLVRRAGLPANGQKPELIRSIRRILGLPEHMEAPVTTNTGPAVVLTLAECFLEYIRLRIPFEIIDLADPSDDVLLIIETFFQRVFGWWTDRHDPNLARRLVCSDPKAAQRIVPLVPVAKFSVGIDATDSLIPPPDVVLPIPPRTTLTYSPRMAVLEASFHFGVVRYTLTPVSPFVVHLNGAPIQNSCRLKDGDVINFGSEEEPMLYAIVMRGESIHTSTHPGIDDQLPVKIWSTREFAGTSLGPRKSSSMHQRAPRHGDVHPDWDFDPYEAPLAPVPRAEMQFTI